MAQNVDDEIGRKQRDYLVLPPSQFWGISLVIFKYNECVSSVYKVNRAQKGPNCQSTLMFISERIVVPIDQMDMKGSDRMHWLKTGLKSGNTRTALSPPSLTFDVLDKWSWKEIQPGHKSGGQNPPGFTAAPGLTQPPSVFYQQLQPPEKVIFQILLERQPSKCLGCHNCFFSVCNSFNFQEI